MSPRRALALVLLLAPAAAGAAAPADARAAARTLVADCAASVVPARTGLAQLEADCPGLSAALIRLGITDSLADGVADQLDAHALGALLAATRSPAQRGPDPATVGAVLAELEADKPQQLSWWQRFRNWLRRLLTPREDGSSPWLTNWLERLTLGKLVREIVVWTVMGLIVVAALVIVVREVRASGLRWPGARRGGAHAPRAAGIAGVFDGGTDWRQLELAQRPAALFRHIAAQLAAAGRLPPPRGYTHRELRQRARLDAPAERAAWQALARAAERQIYAPGRLPDAESQQVVADAAQIWDPERPRP